jgi:hypothetical protein
MPTFNTTDPKPGYVYDSAIDTWFPLVGIAPGSSVVRWRKTAEGGETSFTGLDDLGATLSYNAGTEQVYLNGVLLVRTEDYLATTGTSVTNLGALAASDVIEVISFNATNVQITDALLETDINAKGDLIVGAAVDTAAILASGTNGQVLKVNTSTATGLEWGTVDADIEGVTAGTGISGGGTSGTVTITNSMATAIDAKGDLVAGTGADAFAKLSVGTNGQVLTAASGETTGLSWATPAAGAGNMTQIATGTMSGASVVISGLTSYTDILVIMSGVTNSTADGEAFLRVNATSSNHNSYGFRGQSSEPTPFRILLTNQSDFSLTGNTVSRNNATNVYAIKLTNCKNAGFTDIDSLVQFFNSSNEVSSPAHIKGIFTASEAVSSITLRNSGGSWAGGTYTVWGA